MVYSSVWKSICDCESSIVFCLILLKMSRCCVPSCEETSKKRTFRLHKFPASKRTAEKWISALNYDRLQKSYSSKLVCQKHFERRFLTEKLRLKINAYPTLFSEKEIATGLPSIQEPLEDFSLVDHSYKKDKHLDHTYCCYPEFIRMEEDVPFPPEFDTEINNSPAGSNTQTATPAEVTTEKVTTVKVSPEKVKPAEVTTVEVLSQKMIPVKVKNKLKDNNESLLSKYKMMCTKYKSARKSLNYYKTVKKTQKSRTLGLIEKLTSKLNPIAKQFILMQFRLSNKHEKVRRFSLDEKMIALSIQQQSRTCYRFLKKIFILPSETTLKKLVATLNITPEIEPEILNTNNEEEVNWEDKSISASEDMASDIDYNFTLDEDDLFI